MAKVSVVFIIFISSITQVFGAYIFGYLLHNPIPDESFLLSDDPNSEHRDTDSVFQASQSLGNSTPNTESNDTNQTVTEINLKDGVEIKSNHCSSDKDCTHLFPGNFYCDLHYGQCDTFKKLSQLCRRDEQCESGLICMFGHCEVPIAQGSPGARCAENSDCNENSCCARQHGEKICKERLARGRKCFVPFGGLDYSLNELCPCQEGLYCTNKRSSKSVSSSSPSNGRRIYNNMRCLPKSNSQQQQQH